VSGHGAERANAGRPQVTTAASLERVALELFARRGFEATTVEDIARAAGIGRRTFFRYFRSKNDLVWGDFDAGLAAFDVALHGSDPSTPLAEAVCEAVVLFNRLPAAAVRAHRQRMSLILRTPALQAHSTLRYAQWRDVVAGFVAARTATPVTGLVPQLVAHAALAAALAAYEQWLQDDDADLSALLRSCFALLGLQVDEAGGRAGTAPPRPRTG
jgi:mycofactocin system transcriptional regulator